GGNQEITLPKNSVVVDGSGSEDKDGKIASYKWTKVSGPGSFKIHDPNNRKTEISELRGGTYKFRLTVTDDDKATATDEITVVVNKKAKQMSIAIINGESELMLTDNRLFLNCSDSHDADGEKKRYLWSKKSGPSSYKILYPNNRMTEITGFKEGNY